MAHFFYILVIITGLMFQIIFPINHITNSGLNPHNLAGWMEVQKIVGREHFILIEALMDVLSRTDSWRLKLAHLPARFGLLEF